MEEDEQPILGTCAEMVLLAKEGDEEVARTGQPLLGYNGCKSKEKCFWQAKVIF